MTRKPPPLRRKTNLSHLTNGNMVQERLRCRYGSLQDWKAVGAEIGVSGGMAFRVATTDYEPRDNDIREALGLPVLKPAPVCASCGVVHVRKTCPAARKPAAPRTGPTPRQRRLLAILGMLWTGAKGHADER